MKKCVLVLICVLLIFAFLCNCSNNNVSNDAVASADNVKGTDAPSDTTSPANDEKEHKSEEIFLKTENQALFEELIESNPIDASYAAEQCGGTAREMLEIEMRYADIWFEELTFSCENFASMLNETDKANFMNVQNNWANTVSQEKELINSIFNVEDDYNVHMGSIFSVECAVNYHKAVRERTLYIKYLQYCLESNRFKETEAKVVFQYKRTEDA